MKIASLVALVVTFLLLPVVHSRTQSDDLQGMIYFAPNSARRVTLTRNGALLASFQVPEGVFLSAAYDDQQPTSLAAGRWEFHGDFRLRAQPAGEAPGQPPGRGFEQIMSTAPLVLMVDGVDILMENIDQ